MNPLGPGDRAPEFTLPSADGSRIGLSAMLRRGPVVLYFYPKDFTPNCTIESCSFRDAYEEFRDAGAEVVGVSSDPPDSHGRFAERHRLPFPLLSDAGGEVRRAYGVPRALGILDARVTFVIGTDGVILRRFRSQFRPRKHIEEALEALRGASKPPMATPR